MERNSRAVLSVLLVTPETGTFNLPASASLSMAWPIAPQPTIPIDAAIPLPPQVKLPGPSRHSSPLYPKMPWIQLR